MKKSVWAAGILLPEFKTLDKDIKTDVLIIGGGICGLLCGYFLKQAGVDYIIVEGSKIASGITGNTTAKITALHGLIYNKLIRSAGKEKARMYLDANLKALEEYEKLSRSFECDFVKKDAYTYSLADRETVEAEVRAAEKLGMRAEFTRTTELPFEVEGAVCFKNQAQFNPMKFILGVSQELNIYENTQITEISPHTVTVNHHKIRAGKIIVATHFPFINKHGGYFLKLYQHRSYVSAFSNAALLKGMYVDEDKTGMSFSSFDDLLLIGGGGHRTGKTGGAQKEIREFAREYYPKATVRYEWAAQDCMSADGVPYIGSYSKKTPDLYVASGFNKWGMSSSMAAAMILTDMVMGKKNDTSEVFSPQRSSLHPQLFLNAFEATVNLLTPSAKRCPHMGCALKWNKAEHTWDCPCHGSRFDKNGKLIDNPATGNAGWK